MNYTLKVAIVRRETEDTITLCFKQPGLKKIKYIAGQYLTLIFRINGRRYIRPYSFSSCPGIDEFLEITVKRVPGGIVSNHINDVVKEGDSIETMAPMGDFVYHADKTYRSIYLWGVGSGITPLFSIAKFALGLNDDSVVHLIYGNRNHESTIFLDQLAKLKRTYGNRLVLKHFYTRLIIDKNLPYLVQGRIDQHSAANILEGDQLLNESAHYICGPAGLKESVKIALNHKNIEADNIFSEDFELIKNPADFEDINTQSVKIKFNGLVQIIEVTKGKSILEAALNADIELPYSCQTGNCSTCKGRLIEGNSRMIGLQKERNDIEENEYLLCCTHPVSKDVYIEI